MPGMGRRRVGTTGKDSASFTITLPRDWVSGNKVDRGAELTVVYDDALVVLPPGAGEETAWSLLRTFRRASERAARARAAGVGAEVPA